MVDTGDVPRTYEVVASRAGRRVEVGVRRGVVEVNEMTRTGGVVRTARFMSARVLALVEYPAPQREPDEPARLGDRAVRHERRQAPASDAA